MGQLLFLSVAAFFLERMQLRLALRVLQPIALYKPVGGPSGPSEDEDH